MRYHLAPSILAADFAALGEEVKKVRAAGADYLHIDVMDGMFVPSISLGFPVISAIRKSSDACFDVHLMMESPERYIHEFAACGADMITVHAEACRHLDRVIQQIRAEGKKVGVALNPATSLSVLDYVLDKIDMVLIMTVNPGFGGQKYLESCTGKIKKLRKKIIKKGLNVDIEVDGGINDATVRTVLDAGANVLVAGSAVYGADTEKNVKKYMKILKEYEKEAE